MERLSYLRSTNSDYIDQLYQSYLANPDSIDPTWRYFFEGMDLGVDSGEALAAAETTAPGSAPSQGWQKELAVSELIDAYRALGHRAAQTNPIYPSAAYPELELARFGLSNQDLTQTFQSGAKLGLKNSTLAQIIDSLKKTYCSTIGIEINHIQNREAREWLRQKLEAAQSQPGLDNETKSFILKRLTKVECFERFLHTRYVAQKRFSVEGGDNAIPMLDAMIETGANLGALEFKIGMAHRGRLNVLTNIMGKKPEHMFVEFEGTYKVDLNKGEGDVKYHKGYSADFTTRQGKQVHLSLAANPSHLEFVGAIALGETRAKQDRRGDATGSTVIPIVIHGDAAFAGQGVCYETINMSQLKGYYVGGCLHLVINNQVGFTTDPSDARSTLYSTDLAKMLDCPIVHVNGDDAEAAFWVSRLATEYRQKFKADFMIDLICYRKYGHNEGDEPSFTQPLLYKQIKVHASPRETYAAKLATAGVVSADQSQALVNEINEQYIAAQNIARTENPEPTVSAFEGAWKGFKPATAEDIFAPAKTAVDAAKLQSIAKTINAMPAGFTLHSKLARFFDARLKAVQDGKGIDWGNGETLAYASLVNEGHMVRLSGQDAERGTFTHRHSVVHDFETGQEFCPINQVATAPARYQVYNSLLSETAVMGFEYGYSLAAPQALTIWEAQFGDFANGAQVIIDQFVGSGESKWLRMSGLVLLLPHGYEGQGPEHSSARLERFLGLCGKNNMTVANLTTPAQVFHALRRQVKRDFRKPLVIMSPKSMLRHPLAVSQLDEFTLGGFQEVIDDATFASDAAAKSVKRVVICSGKIYYELLAARAESKDLAIVRLEQIYPFPAARLAKVLARYSGAKDIVWTQEEPRNMGAWPFVFGTWAGGIDYFQAQVGNRAIRYVGRGVACAPAVGSAKVHETEQKAIIEQAITQGTMEISS